MSEDKSPRVLIMNLAVEGPYGRGEYVQKQIEVVEHSAYLAVKQELDAALFNKKSNDEDYLKVSKQLADAKAQIADYEAALEYYKSTWDVGIKARETLNKWKAK